MAVDAVQAAQPDAKDVIHVQVHAVGQVVTRHAVLDVVAVVRNCVIQDAKVDVKTDAMGVHQLVGPHVVDVLDHVKDVLIVVPVDVLVQCLVERTKI